MISVDDLCIGRRLQASAAALAFFAPLYTLSVPRMMENRVRCSLLLTFLNRTSG